MPVDVGEVPTPRRRNRFDRTKEPHDWRWVLGIVGRTLVSAGVLMFGFVVYQLWGTGIQTAREQTRLRQEFDELMETVTTLAPMTTTTSIEVAAPTTTAGIPQATTTTVDPISTAPPPVISAPAEGEPVARLAIPAMDIEDKIVIEGVQPADLQDGPGHFPETPLPGQVGNAAIAGHRTTHGEPFRKIDLLQPGDDITVTTLAGVYVYVVTGQLIVDPSDYELVIPTVDPAKATLTLTSCHPTWKSTHRIVVFADLDPTRSSPVTLPSNLPGVTPTGSIPGDDPVTPVPGEPATTAVDTTVASPAATPSTVAATDPESTDASSTVPATTPPTTTLPGITGIDPPTDSEELFQNKWFSEPAAFPQVALWGVALIAVSLGAYWVSRRARRYWVGALVGVVPFTVVLYFFYQNVNRLLPPNL